MKQTIVIGSHNRDKAREIAAILREPGIRVRTIDDYSPCKEPVEDGRTFEANARKKARAYSRHVRALALADDSGLMVDRLGGKPGVYSARFAGPGCSYDDNNAKTLRLLRGVPPSRRTARFVCVIALYDHGRPVGVARGVCRGRIADAPRGKKGFGYDPIFVPAGMKKTYAELPPAAKGKISHRGRALRAARKLILSYLRRKSS